MFAIVSSIPRDVIQPLGKVCLNEAFHFINNRFPALRQVSFSCSTLETRHRLVALVGKVPYISEIVFEFQIWVLYRKLWITDKFLSHNCLGIYHFSEQSEISRKDNHSSWVRIAQAIRISYMTETLNLSYFPAFPLLIVYDKFLCIIHWCLHPMVKNTSEQCRCLCREPPWPLSNNCTAFYFNRHWHYYYSIPVSHKIGVIKVTYYNQVSCAWRGFKHN